MSISSLIRQHWAALRALLVLTVIVGGAYPLLIWLVAHLPWLDDKADGSIVYAGGKPLGSSLIGQSFTDADGNPIPRYFQGRPSAADYDAMASGASNLGPESIVDTPDKPSLLSQVCTRSAEIGKRDGVDGSRPYCTGGGVGAVLSVEPTRVVSVNEFCPAVPFLTTYQGVRVECAVPGDDHAAGRLVPIRGAAPSQSAVPADAVTASGSGLDPDISPAYADQQIARVSAARGINPDQVRQVVAAHTSGRTLGFMGEPTVDVLAVNLALDRLGG